MGCYVNLEQETKEQFLEREGAKVDLEKFKWEDIPKEHLPVIWVDNNTHEPDTIEKKNGFVIARIGGRPFTAAAVIYEEEELESFRDPSDPRAKQMYFVPVSKLLEVSDLDRFMSDDMTQ